MVLLAIALAGMRAVGLTPYAILSGSMEPAYSAGDLAYVAKAAPENIQVGDIIAYTSDSALQTVTHRVVEVRPDGSFTTKGDANESPDAAPVPPENVLGTVSFALPKLGYASVYFATDSGRLVGIACALALVLVLFVVPALVRATKKEREGAQKSRAHVGND